MPYQPAVLGTARLNNFRLNYLTPAQAASRPAYVWIILGGINVSGPASATRVLYKSASIRDLVFDTPNTCNLTFYGAAPTLGQRLEVWVDSDAPKLLFGGELQTVDRTYKGRPGTVLHPCTAIDDTAAANRKRPLGLWTNTSATTIAQWLISTFAPPGFSSAGVEPGLPAVTVNFDGSEGGMKGCLTQLAKMIGGYWFFENKVLYLFLTPPGPAPDPIDDTPGRFLHEPQIKWTVDKSQVRTRVFGKGASSDLAATVDPTVTIVPLEEATMFNPAGGKAIAAVTPDGAASRVLTYTGVQAGGGGGLVGPGAAPSSAPGLALAAGAGIESGVHGYAITFTTAAGESLPGPVASITVGQLDNAAGAPTPGSPTTGGAVNPGTYQYGATFTTASGETAIAVVSAPVTIATSGYYVPAPTVKPAPYINPPSTAGTQQWLAGDLIKYQTVFVNAAGTTTPGPVSITITAQQNPNLPAGWCKIIGVLDIAKSPDPSVTGIRLYRIRNNVSAGYHSLTNTNQSFEDGGLTAPGAVPTSNTAFVSGAAYQTIPLTQIPIGPALVTGRKLYRYSDAVGWKYLDTIANNTATTYTDTKANSALGAAPPAANTATANQVAVTVALGGSGVTGRRLYRTAANQTPLKLLMQWAENTTTAWTDLYSDTILGAAPPAVDTSGLKQPEGQALPGSTTLVVANTSAFVPSGGWAIVGNGEQTIRYTGITGSSLTGIPPTGVGALTAAISYNSTITAAPALVGVAGILEMMLRGAPVHVWVQRDDPAAQAYMQALDGGGDGVYEHIVSDERRSEASLRQVCDAELELYSRPFVTVVYASRDTKTKSGKTVQIALASPAIAESLTIQDVTISEIGIAPTLKPKFTVTASSVRHSFDAILRMLIRKADA